ncbi:MAG: hypothetical protein ACO1SX_15745 [Actinomycetota bacterium]
MTLRKPELYFLALGLGVGIVIGRSATPPTNAGASSNPSATIALRPRATRIRPPARAPEPQAAPEIPAPSPMRPLFVPLVSKPQLVEAEDAAQVTLRATGATPDPVAPPPAEEPAEEAPGLALVGVTVSEGGVNAVIEELESGLSRTVGAGERVFGAEVVRIGDGEVVLSRDGETETLLLGAGKLETKVELLSDGYNLRLSDPLNSALKELPSPVLATVARTLPRAGVLRRVRSYTDNGQRVHRIEKVVDGLEHELRVSDDGAVLQLEASLRIADVPAAVVDSANRAVPGYRINSDDTPRLLDRNGQRYYLIEVRREGGSEELDLRIAGDGRVLGQG